MPPWAKIAGYPRAKGCYCSDAEQRKCRAQGQRTPREPKGRGGAWTEEREARNERRATREGAASRADRRRAGQHRVANGNWLAGLPVLADMAGISLLMLVMGLLLGAVLGFLIARNREAAAVTDLTARASAADERARAAEQRTALVDGQLAERFQALSAQALDASTRRFLEMAEGRLTAANAKATGELEARRAAVEGLVEPLKQTLTRVEAQLRDSDAARE